LIGNRVKGFARIRSIQFMHEEVQYIEPQLDQEIGLRFERRCREGMTIAQVVRATSEPQQIEIPFAYRRPDEQSEENEPANADSDEPGE
jgi:hypothetical protein